MLSEKEIDSMVTKPAKVRFEYATKRVADFGLVWVIEENEKFILLGDNNGNLIFPIWPNEEYAELFCTGDYSNCIVSSIEIHDFLDLEIPNFKNAGYKLSVFPLNSVQGMVIEIPIFIEEIQELLDEIE